MQRENYTFLCVSSPAQPVFSFLLLTSFAPPLTSFVFLPQAKNENLHTIDE